MIPFWGQKLAQDFDPVIHLDADSIVVDSLPELLRGDFDVAGVRNNDDFGDLSFTCPGVPVHEYMNCGLVAATHRQFWDDLSSRGRTASPSVSATSRRGSSWSSRILRPARCGP